MITLQKKYSRSFKLLTGILAFQMAFLNVTPALAAPTPGAMVAVAVSQAYDGNNNMVTRTDGNGKVTTFTYDAVNRLTAIDYPGGGSPDVTFGYDANGNRTSMTDATGTTLYDYDFYDRLIGINYPDGNFVLYTHDDVGNITDLQYGNVLVLVYLGVYTYIHYEFDADNRIVSVLNVATGHKTTYAYDAAGNVSRRTLPNNAYTDYGYDADGRLTSVDHRKSDNNLICKYQYALNAIGNRTNVVETMPGATNRTSYTYDPLDRLDTVTYPNGRFVDYGYDSFGNRTNMIEVVAGKTNRTAYTYDSDSRLLSTTTNGTPCEYFFYDTTGNLVQQVRPSDKRQKDYVYDYENRLVRYFDGTNNVEYAYNGVGERVVKIVNGVRKNYLNDPNRQYVQVLAETDDIGIAERVYEWGNELINQEDIVGTNRHYYLHDAINGNVRRLVDAGQSVVNSYEYDAFGTVTTETEGIASDYQFHGEVQEKETGLVFLRARYAAIEIGRFLTREPKRGEKENPVSFAPYLAFGGNPVSFRDPSGLDYMDYFWIGYAAFACGFGGYAEGFIHVAGVIASTPPGPVGYSYGGNRLGASVFDNYERYGSGLGGRGAGEWTSGGRSEMQWLLNSDSGRYSGGFYGGSRSSLSPAESLRYGYGKPGGVALNKSANVLLDISNITGGTYDQASGQIILYGSTNSPTALPPMNMDDMAVAFRAVNQGTFPVVSIEDPLVYSPPEWPSRTCFTVRYGPFQTDPVTGQTNVLDVSSKTHFGWVMYDADRHMKCLGMGKDNRTGAAVSSSVPGYYSWADLAFQYWGTGSTQTRFWFNPKEIQVAPSADGKSLEFKKAEMQLSTECMFSSGGNAESTPDGEYFANWFTVNYDAIAAEQTTRDATNGVHYIFKELKELAQLAGIVEWVKDNDIPMDLKFLESYTPKYWSEADSYSPQTTVTKTRTVGNQRLTVTIKGGVNYFKPLDLAPGNPTGTAARAISGRSAETNLSWTFNESGTNLNVTAFSVDRTAKDGGFSHSDVDASMEVKGDFPLVLGRYFDSMNVVPTAFGWGWQVQPYALELRGELVKLFQGTYGWEFDGYGEVWYQDRAAQAACKYALCGTYNTAADPLHLNSRFDTNEMVLVYRFQDKDTPGLLFTDNKTRLTMRLAEGSLLDFDMDGRLTRTEDRNGNQIVYTYDGSKRLTSFGQAGGRSISLAYDSSSRVTGATLPDGHSVTYIYDASNNLTTAQVDVPTGKKMLYAYDGDHNLREVRDENGTAVASRAYDVYGRVTGTTQPGVSTPFAQNYSLAAKTSQTTGPEGFKQALEFDANFDPIKVTDARSNVTERTYNQFRSVIAERKPDGTTWTHYYDYRGNRVATAVPNGRADVTFLDANNNPYLTYHSVVDADFAGSFDAEQVLATNNMRILSADFSWSQYDGKGNLTNSLDANGHVKCYGYDAFGNRTWSKDGRSNRTDYAYDAYSQITNVVNALGHRVRYAYDDRDNRTNVATTAGSVAYGYNLKNQLTSVTKGDSGVRRTTTYTYDAKGSIQTVTDPAGILTRYGYDARGNLTNIVHDGIQRFSYEYDGLNRLTATRYSGTAGGGQAAVVPAGPTGTEYLKGDITIKWNTLGDWTGNTNLTIQYSLNGVDWFTIATVSAASGSYVWHTGAMASDSVRLRFVRSGDAEFLVATTAAFSVLNGGQYYVNDGSTVGDQYCTVTGCVYNGTSVTGLSPTNPVNRIQDIIGNYPLQPGDTVFIDTGSYTITNDIVITSADEGTWTKPVTFTGPTNSGASAVITHANASNSLAGIYVMGAEGIVLEHLKVAKARHGIRLFNSYFCSVLDNECFSNGVAGAAGQEGSGAGISVGGEGVNLITNNICRYNGANGGSGAAGKDGGAGRGFGIVIQSSYSNTVSGNICYRNGGTGGGAGSATNRQGYSEASGIRIETTDTNMVAEWNQITDNRCYNNVAIGRSESVTDADGGTARAYGIALMETHNSNIERNTSFGNWGWGGRSWNNLETGGKGGLGIGYGIYGQDEADLIVTKNYSYSNWGDGEYGGNDADDTIGTGWAAGIYLRRCRNSILKNNRCCYNKASTWGTWGTEPEGAAFSSGVELETSPGCTVANNTLIQNRAAVNLSGGTGNAIVLVSQAYFWGGSSSNVVKNNICDVFHPDSSALWVQPESTAGLTSDYNALYVHGAGFMGMWGTTYCASVTSWRAASGLDQHSLTNEPGYYNAASNDFHLAHHSPLVDAGEALADVLEDGDGEPRPTAHGQDIGYDEFVDSDQDNLADVTERTVTYSNPQESDTDHDGLPDGWEVDAGLNPNSATGIDGAGGDPDGDTYSNLAEYNGGSNPRSIASIPPEPPRLTAFVPAGAAQFLLEEDALLLSADAQDPNGETVAYSWRVDGAVKSSSNTFLFATTSDSSGSNTLSKSYVVELRVSAGTDTVARSWTVTVNNRNHAPVLQTMSNVTARVGETVALHPACHDPDNTNGVPGDDNTLSVEYTGWMTSSTKLTGTNDFGLHPVTVTVRDNGSPSLTAQQTIEVNVTGPNLTPWQPTNWSDRIVVSTGPGTHTDGFPIEADRPVYVSYAEGNDGSSYAEAAKTRLVVDGQTANTTQRSTNLAAQSVFAVEDFAFTFTNSGWHTLQMSVDADGQVAETHEDDNAYLKRVYVFQSGATNDPDHDGMLSWEEEVAGTDPNNATNVFALRITSSQNPVGHPILSWNSITGRLYGLLYSTNLPGMWTNVQDYTDVPGVTPSMSYTNLTPSAVEFFKINVRLSE